MELVVIVPSTRPEGLRRLLGDLARQTIRPHVEVVRDVSPNGRARNQGVARAPRADVLVFVDDDARLLEAAALERLIAPLRRDPTLAVSGAAKVLPPDATRFERRVAREVPRVVHEAVAVDRESNPSPTGYGFSDVTTTCCAVRREWFDRIGGFREDIARGVDTEAFARLRRAGARFVVAAGARVAHGAPRDLRSLLARMVELGEGHARENALDPARRIGPRLTSRARALAYLALRTLYLPVNLVVPYSAMTPRVSLEVMPLKALASYAAAVGYVRGSL